MFAIKNGMYWLICKKFRENENDKKSFTSYNIKISVSFNVKITESLQLDIKRIKFLRKMSFFIFFLKTLYKTSQILRKIVILTNKDSTRFNFISMYRQEKSFEYLFLKNYLIKESNYTN